MLFSGMGVGRKRAESWEKLSEKNVHLTSEALFWTLTPLHYSELVVRACVHPKLLQSCPALCDTMGCNLTGPSAGGLLQAGYWSGLPRPPPGDLPDPGMGSGSLMSPALADRFFITRLWAGHLNSQSLIGAICIMGMWYSSHRDLVR